jgi:phosphate transport system permease protein
MSAIDVTVPVAGSPAAGIVRTKRRYGERLVILSLAASAGLSIAVTVGIVVSLVQPSVAFFREIRFGEFLFGTTWAPLFTPPKFGVLPIVAGSLLITGIATLVAVPLGLGAAIYLSEYADQRVRKVVKPALELLEGIPTVVYGYFAVSFVAPYVQRWWPIGDTPGVFSALAAGLVMGIMIIPTMGSLSEDALRAVPIDLRQGGYALGARRYEVATRVTVPAALSGIVAAFVLSVSRAIGETMIVFIAAGNTPNLTFNPGEAVQTMTAFIAQAGTGDLPQGSIGYKTIFAVGSLLFVITFVMNVVSNRVVARYREVYD